MTSPASAETSSAGNDQIAGVPEPIGMAGQRRRLRTPCRSFRDLARSWQALANAVGTKPQGRDRRRWATTGAEARVPIRQCCRIADNRNRDVTAAPGSHPARLLKLAKR